MHTVMCPGMHVVRCRGPAVVDRSHINYSCRDHMLAYVIRREVVSMFEVRARRFGPTDKKTPSDPLKLFRRF